MSPLPLTCRICGKTCPTELESFSYPIINVCSESCADVFEESEGWRPGSKPARFRMTLWSYLRSEDCGHGNTYVVRDSSDFMKRAVKHEVCRDCEHLIITVDGEVRHVLSKRNERDVA